MMNRVNTASPLGRDSRHRRLRIAVIVASVVAAIVGSSLLATRDSGEKVTTRGITATLRVPSHPGWLTAGRDALWLALTDAKPPVRDRPLLRLDLVTGAVQRSVFVGGQASYLMHVGNRLLASVEHVGGAGSGPSLVVALDWRSGRVLLRRQFAGPVGPLAEGGKDLWALQIRPAALLRLDSRTLTPTAAPLRLSPGRSLGLAVGAGYVWVTAADAGEVLRIDPATRAITRLRVGGFPVGILVTGGGVWVADRERGAVVRVEPRTFRPVGEPIHVGAEASWLGAAGGYLFVGNAGRGTVTRIDVRSGKKVGAPIRFAQPAKDAPAFAIAPSGTSVWLSSFASNTLTRISSTAVVAPAAAATVSRAQGTSTVARALPRGGKVVAQIAVPAAGGAFTIGEGAVWAMSDLTSTLMRIDPGRNAVVARIKVPRAESAAAGDGAVWLSHPGRAAGATDSGFPLNSVDLGAIPEVRNSRRCFDRRSRISGPTRSRRRDEQAESSHRSERRIARLRNRGRRHGVGKRGCAGQGTPAWRQGRRDDRDSGGVWRIRAGRGSGLGNERRGLDADPDRPAGEHGCCQHQGRTRQGVPAVRLR